MSAVLVDGRCALKGEAQCTPYRVQHPQRIVVEVDVRGNRVLHTKSHKNAHNA